MEFNIGDKYLDGKLAIIDKDRLCYKVYNYYKDLITIRTISRDIIEEYIEFLKTHPNLNAEEVREALKGKSEIDNFEYGYTSTIYKLAKLGIELESKKTHIFSQSNRTCPLQQIFFGAPGTGKSHEVKIETSGEDVIRTTFHPDTDYSTFVGAYKPTTTSDGKIVYEFVSQAFLLAYVAAWKKYAHSADGLLEKQFLVIEEINRGNCAQIFGDLFQLLDRNDEGFSEYYIKTDMDLQKQLVKSFGNMKISQYDSINELYGEDVVKKVLDGEILLLPNNFYIWATMNTSDQSLFPVDSAFKRRWDWKYMPIADADMDYRIKVNNTFYDWWDFLQKINKRIAEATSSEDKKLGYFFCKPKDGIITADKFVSKVLFYLWTDVFKDLDDDINIFQNSNNESITFDMFYKLDSKGKAVIDTDTVELILQRMNIMIVEDIDDNTIYNTDEELSYEADNEEEIGSLVVYLNNEKIKGSSSIDIFAKTIQRIGVKAVAKLGIKVSEYDLLSRKKLPDDTPGGYARGQKLIDGYWLNAKSNNKNKVKILERITDSLNINLEAYIKEDDDEAINVSESNSGATDYSKFSINGSGSYPKRLLPQKVMELYVEMNPDLRADNVINEWKDLSSISHFVENDKEHFNRSANGQERCKSVMCANRTQVWVSTEWTKNSIMEFIKNLHKKNWGIKIAKL